MIPGLLWKRAVGRKSVWFSLVVMLLLTLTAAFAPRIAPHDPYRWEIYKTSRPPAWVKEAAKPGLAENLLGTDRFGRDILSRLVYGTRTGLLLALSAAGIAGLLGSLAGFIAGYAQSWPDTLLRFMMDIVQSIPGIMVAVIVILIFRGIFPPTWHHGMLTLVIAFSVTGWVSLARLVRVQVLLVRSQLFIEAAASLGASPAFIILKHLLPNVLHVIVVWVINTIPAVILLEAILGYIGVGITNAVDGSEFTVVSWGGVFYSGRSVMSSNPLMLILPSLGILLISMSFILLGNFINDSTREG